MDPDFADDDGLGKMRFPSRGYATKHGMAAPETLMAGITSSGMIDEKKAGAPAMVHVAPYLVEFIGTFFLVHVISLLGPTVVGPLAVGAILMAMVFMGGHISGGVYNPAVTLALVLRGEIGWMKGVGYMLVQVIGGIAGGTAGFTMRKLPDESFSCPAPMGDYTTTNAFFAEMLYTTALCYVVLSVATSKPNHGNSYFGLAIGFTVLSGAVLVGDISGAVFNPAVGSGISVAALIYDPHQSCPVWIYWAAPMAGAIVAAALYRVTNFDSFLPKVEFGAHPPKSQLRHYAKPLMEFIGTYYLVLAIALTGHLPPMFNQLAPLAIGSSLMVFVFAGGHISGALYNPAVSLGVSLRGQDLLHWTGLLVFWVVQVGAAIAAAFTGHWLTGDTIHPEPTTPYSKGQAFAAEFSFTFALVSVVLNVATAKAYDGNHFFGLAIGFTVMSGAIAVAGISGAAFNPAVATGLTLVAAVYGDHSAFDNLWIYWGAPLGAAILAAGVFYVTNSGERHAARLEEQVNAPAPNRVSTNEMSPLLHDDNLAPAGGYKAPGPVRGSVGLGTDPF